MSKKRNKGKKSNVTAPKTVTFNATCVFLNDMSRQVLIGTEAKVSRLKRGFGADSYIAMQSLGSDTDINRLKTTVSTWEEITDRRQSIAE
jgi:hypothetical protein